MPVKLHRSCTKKNPNIKYCLLVLYKLPVLSHNMPVLSSFALCQYFLVLHYASTVYCNFMPLEEAIQLDYTELHVVLLSFSSTSKVGKSPL